MALTDAPPSGPAEPRPASPGARSGNRRGRHGVLELGEEARWSHRLALRLVSIGVIAFVWWAVTEAGVWSELFLPRPGAVWDRFLESLGTTTTVTSSGLEITRRGLGGYTLWEHWWASVSRILRGLGFAILIGVPLGLLLATVRWFRLLVEPWVDFLRSLPPLAYFSLLIIWFGIEDTSKVWLLFLAAVAPIALSIQTTVHIVLPSVLPEFFNGFHLATGFAWTTIVAAETTDGIPGVGGLAWVSKSVQQTDTVLLCIITIGITALALDHLIRTVDRRIVPWRGH